MTRPFCFLLLLGLLVGSFAQAEVQEITISGVIDYDFIWRNNMEDFNDNKKDQPAYSELELYLPVRAVMSDNVSAEIELREDVLGNGVASKNIGLDIDEAFVTLEEFLWEPLSLKIGKQPLFYSIRGNTCCAFSQGMRSLRRTNFFLFSGCEDPLGVRARLDFNRWGFDFFGVKYDELSKQGTNSRPNHARDETGNSSDMDVYGSAADCRWGGKSLFRVLLAHLNNNAANSSLRNSAGNFQAANRQQTALLPGVDAFLLDDKLELFGELGYQFGEYDHPSAGGLDTDANAWGGYFGCEYAFDCKYKPYLGSECKYLEGDEGDDAQWQMWKGKETLALIFEGFKQDHTALETGGYARAGVYGGLKALPHNMYFELPLCYFWDTDDRAGDAYGDQIGWEVDAIWGWFYTPDVKFEAGLGWFFVDEEYAQNGGSRGRNGLNPNAPHDNAWLLVWNTTLVF